MLLQFGLDKGSGNTLKLTLQLATLNSNSQDSSGSSQSENTVLETVECASIDAGINLVNSYISKKVNLSHCKAIIISEELASVGLSEYLYTLVNNIEIRPDCNVIISRCDASELLKHSEPTLESVSARYYELVLNSSEYTGYLEDMTLNDFYSDLLSPTTEGHAILSNINTEATHSSNYNLPSYDISGSYKAGQTPIESNAGIENIGIAVFKEDKLVGELNGTETLCHLILTNRLNSSVITIPSPFNEGESLSIYITLAKNTDKNLEFINNTPFITCKVYINANILSIDKYSDFSSQENLEIIKDYLNTYLEQNILSCLYKTSKEFKSDIFDFGTLALKKYYVWQDFEISDWLNNYENSFFKIEMNSTVQPRRIIY